MGMSTQNDQMVYRGRKKMMIDNFLGGVMWSLGTLVGGAIIILIIGILISKIDLVPIIGSWLREILQEAFKGQAIKGVRI